MLCCTVTGVGGSGNGGVASQGVQVAWVTLRRRQESNPRCHGRLHCGLSSWRAALWGCVVVGVVRIMFTEFFNDNTERVVSRVATSSLVVLNLTFGIGCSSRG